MRGAVVSVANGVGYSFSEGFHRIFPIAVVFGFASNYDTAAYISFDEG